MTQPTASPTHAPATAYAVRVADAVAGPNASALRRLGSELRRAAACAAPRSRDRGAYEALLGVVEAARASSSGGEGLAPQSAPLEPGSLAARMLSEIAAGVQGANADLADRLGTDQWQVSRAGRRLRDLGLATRVRSGRLNGWAVTASGQRQVNRLRRPHHQA